MPKVFSRLSFWAVIFVLLAIGCQKRDVKYTAVQTHDTALVNTNCNTILYGMVTVPDTTYLDSALTMADVNKQSGKKTSLFSYGKGSCYANHAVIMDGLYAIMLPDKWNGSRSAKTTLRFKSLGATLYNEAVFDNTVLGLAVNTSKHTFYAAAYGPSGNDTLISFQIATGSIANIQSLGVFKHTWSSPPSLAVDERTGTVYIAGTDNATGTTIYQYSAGTSVRVVDSANPAKYSMLGLTYDPNDRNLYAIDQSASANVLRIDPRSGTTTTIATLPEPINNEFYSVAFEKCSDRLYISGKGANSQGIMVVCDLLTGKYGSYHIPYFYQGLAINVL